MALSDLGGRLKEERERLNLSQTEFARLGGTSKHSQIRYESGDGSPTAAYLEQLSAHGVDVYYVISGVRRSQLVQAEAAITAASAVDLVAEVMTEMNLQGKLSMPEIKTLVGFVLDHQADKPTLLRFLAGATEVFRPDLADAAKQARS